MSRLTELATELRGLKDKKERLEEELKSVNKQIGVVQNKQLPEAMDDADIEKFTVEGVGTIYLQTKLNAYVKADDRPRLYDWCRENGHEALIVDYIWPATFNSWAKDQLAAGEPLPDFVSAAFLPTAVIRRK